MGKVDKVTMRKIIYIVKNNNNDKEKVNWVINTVINTGGIKYAEQKMNEYRDEALAIIDEFPNSKVGDALKDLVRYTTDRKF